MLKKLIEFDRAMGNRLNKLIVGLDEVGRGCLAGPVVAAAVQLPDIEEDSELARALFFLNDSKKLPAGKREFLAAVIVKVSHYAIGEASVEEIEDLNILRASLLAMKRAWQQLGSTTKLTLPVVLLVDGNQTIPDVSERQIMIVKGDCQSASIAAASIVAKVHRDALMVKLDKEHPAYGWSCNKGYGSKAHRQALQKLGPTHLHRKVFLRKILGDSG